MSRSKTLDDAIADIHLIVQVSTLELIELPIKLGLDILIRHLLHQITMEKRSVETTDDIVMNAIGIFRRKDKAHVGREVISQLSPFEQVERIDGLVENRTLASPIDSTEDVHIRLQFPRDVLASPQSTYFDTLDIIGLFLHNNYYLQRKKPMPKRSVAALSRSSLTLGSAMEISNFARSHNDLLRKYTMPCSVAMY